MGDEESHDIKIHDKRRFTTEGATREGEDVKTDAAPSEPAREEPAQTAHEDKAQSPHTAHEMPPIDFPTFILSLASSAQVHLGLIPNPESGKAEKRLDIAKQTIDILGVLRDKTMGNLTKDEERLFEAVLYDLRMKYVELTK